MKRIFSFSLLLVFFILVTGCTKKLTIPETNEITIYELNDQCEKVNGKSVTFTDESNIYELISNLNNLHYKLTNEELNTCSNGYLVDYKISNITVINDKYFYFKDNNKDIYELTDSNFSFLSNYNKTQVNVVNKAELVNKFDNDESFIFVLGTSTCSSCVKYKSNTLTTYVNEENFYPLVFAYSDKTFFSNDDVASFLNKYNLTYQASPTTYFIKNGNVVNKVEGNISIESLKQFINENK